MPDITQQRCRNHVGREAVACCPSCGRYFCRECVTEHEDRVLCAACLRSLVEPARQEARHWRSLIQSGQLLLGMLILYITFYYLGEILLAIPTEFHDGTLWKADWWAG